MEDFFYPYLKRYLHSGPQIQQWAGRIYRLIPDHLKYGSVYRHYQQLLRESSAWSISKVRSFQLESLRITLLNAYQHCPYYTHLFQQIGLDPHHISDPKQLEQIPFLTKEIILKEKENIINRSIPKRKLMYVTTGGTSGITSVMYFTKGRERAREKAFMQEIWNRGGYRPGVPYAVLRGNFLLPKHQDDIIRYDSIRKRLLLSVYDMTPDNMTRYVKKLQSFKPRFIHAYPSALFLLVKHMKSTGQKLSGIEAVFCGSEPVFEDQRAFIETYLNTRILSWYGHTEMSVLAGECEQSSDYHLFFEYGFVELIDENGMAISKSGVRGEIVGTSFEMKGFPLIRFRTGDYAEYADGPCSCGRNYTLIRNVEGRRMQELIVSRKGNKIPITPINMHDDTYRNVLQYQFFQDTPGKLTLRLIPAPNYGSEDYERIKQALGIKLRDHVELDLLVTDKMICSPRGKHLMLISELKDNI
jgi:phenylacetate-CoA ligase